MYIQIFQNDCFLVPVILAVTCCSNCFHWSLFFSFYFANIYTETKFKEILRKEFLLSNFDKYFYLARVKLLVQRSRIRGFYIQESSSLQNIDSLNWQEEIHLDCNRTFHLAMEYIENIFPFQKNYYLYNLLNILLTSAVFLDKILFCYTRWYLPVDKLKSNDMKYITSHYYFLTLSTSHQK